MGSRLPPASEIRIENANEEQIAGNNKGLLYRLISRLALVNFAYDEHAASPREQFYTYLR